MTGTKVSRGKRKKKLILIFRWKKEKNNKICDICIIPKKIINLIGCTRGVVK